MPPSPAPSPPMPPGPVYPRNATRLVPSACAVDALLRAGRLAESATAGDCGVDSARILLAKAGRAFTCDDVRAEPARAFREAVVAPPVSAVCWLGGAPRSFHILPRSSSRHTQTPQHKHPSERRSSRALFALRPIPRPSFAAPPRQRSSPARSPTAPWSPTLWPRASAGGAPEPPPSRCACPGRRRSPRPRRRGCGRGRCSARARGSALPSSRRDHDAATPFLALLPSCALSLLLLAAPLAGRAAALRLRCCAHGGGRNDTILPCRVFGQALAAAVGTSLVLLHAHDGTAGARVVTAETFHATPAEAGDAGASCSEEPSWPPGVLVIWRSGSHYWPVVRRRRAPAPPHQSLPPQSQSAAPATTDGRWGGEAWDWRLTCCAPLPSPRIRPLRSSGRQRLRVRGGRRLRGPVPAPAAPRLAGS